MPPTPSVNVRIDLQRIRRNIEEIRSLTQTPIYAVIKSDAYGTGAATIAPAIADLVERFCVFTLDEAIEAQIWDRAHKETLALGPNPDATAEDFIRHHVRPSIWDAARASVLRSAHPLLSVDTGMQRFSCPAEQIDDALKAGACDEAFTHATSVQSVHRLMDLVGGRGLKLHAAGTSLLNEPQAWLDAVRPGLALYRGAIEISAPLIDVRTSRGPAGYSGFSSPHHGVILCGYSHGLRPGPCMVNGRRSRLLEVGMQSAFVETTPGERVGDRVVLLGEGLTETEVAKEWGTSPHEVLSRLCRAGQREYVE